MSDPTRPRTEAGRNLLEALIGLGVDNDAGEALHDIRAIEDEAALSTTPAPLDVERLDTSLAALGVHVDLRHDPPRDIGCGSCRPAIEAIAREYAKP